LITLKQTDFVSVKKMREIDKAAVQYGMPIELMMENTGRAISSEIKKRFQNFRTKIVCLAGKGNNGGGVIAAARHLSCLNFRVTLVMLSSRNSQSKPSKLHFSLIRKNPKIQVIFTSQRTQNEVFSSINKSQVIVDGIFGTGFKDRVKEPEYTIISLVNKSKAFVICNDVPSGINADSGKTSNISIKADFIVVLHKPKKWMVSTKPLPKFSVASLGIPPEIDPPFFH